MKKYLTSVLVWCVLVIGFAQATDYRNNVEERSAERVELVKIMPRSSWSAAEPRPFKQQKIERLTIHHEGGRVLTIDDDAKQRLKNIQTWCMGPDRNWADIPYHFLIAPDGTVYEGRNVYTVGETNTEYDPQGHVHISFLGNYTEQTLTPKLLEVLTDLLTDLCVKYEVDPSMIATHRDYSKMTVCPGEDIYSYFKSGYVVDEVKRKLNK